MQAPLGQVLPCRGAAPAPSGSRCRPPRGHVCTGAVGGSPPGSQGSHPGLAAPRSRVGRAAPSTVPVEGHPGGGTSSGPGGAGGPRGSSGSGRWCRRGGQEPGLAAAGFPAGHAGFLQKPWHRPAPAQMPHLPKSGFLCSVLRQETQLSSFPPPRVPPRRGGCRFGTAPPSPRSPASHSLVGSGLVFRQHSPGGFAGAAVGAAPAPALLPQHPSQLGQAWHGHRAAGEGTVGRSAVARGPGGVSHASMCTQGRALTLSHRI